MDSAAEIEARRLVVQGELDAGRPAEGRNRLGQYATPPGLAAEVARHMVDLMRRRSGRPAAFLEPSVGSGSFYSALLRASRPGELADACGVEVDPAFAAAARGLWGGSGLRVVEGDFTRLAPDRAYDLVLANPPYTRHHLLAPADKARLRAAVAAGTGLDIGGRAGLYAHTLLLADAWMAPGGLAAWLVPSEFMDVGYGAAVRAYLTDRVTLLRVHRFDPGDAQFRDATVTSAVVVFAKAPAPPGHRARLSVGGPLADPAASAEVDLESLRRSAKWTGAGGPAPRGGPALGDFFTIRRGLVTGANAFFILGRDEAARRGIPAEFLRPILPGARALAGPVVEAGPDGHPLVDGPAVLVDCGLPEREVRERHPGLWAYLEAGRAAGLPAGYLASRRDPWYRQERREPAPFLCTYMGRRRGGGNPFRLFWNRSGAVAPNVYLMMYPRAGLAARPDLHPAVLAGLLSIGGDAFVREGRVYGGGLHKIEPGELARVPAAEIGRILRAAS